jgi:zinc D-Ala-D-Ala carboxypeptidase
VGRKLHAAAVVVCVACALQPLPAERAAARGSLRAVKPGDSGRSVRRLQVRVAGWFPGSSRRVHFALDGAYGGHTIAAVKAFQRHHGLVADGIAGSSTMAVLRRLTDADGSTRHFDWSEFDQNRNASCSAAANAYAGTFGGGMVSARRAKRNVRRLMWRLEAARAKGKGAIGINSGFRSVRYNDCIGGARSSQHMYGTAADNRMVGVGNHRERRIARRSQFHGIGCYASLTHNHFDIRMDNPHLPSSRFWWWPRRDARGRDLDANGRPCWGERRRGRSPLVSGASQIAAFVRAGEPADLRGAD